MKLKLDGTDPVGLAKWDLWKALEGFDEEKAAKQYVVTFQSVRKSPRSSRQAANQQVLRASDQPEAKTMLAQIQAMSAVPSA